MIYASEIKTPMRFGKKILDVVQKYGKNLGFFEKKFKKIKISQKKLLIFYLHHADVILLIISTNLGEVFCDKKSKLKFWMRRHQKSTFLNRGKCSAGSSFTENPLANARLPPTPYPSWGGVQMANQKKRRNG